MPNYFYTAKSFDGTTKTGNITAKDTRELAQMLKSENLFLIYPILEKEKKKSGLNGLVPSFGVSTTEKILMTRNLWIMFAAGLSLVKIFDILSAQSKNPKLKNIMIDVSKRLNKGESFSGALAQYPKVFNEFFLSMVKIGEESGTLEDVFEILSTHMDRDHELRSKIRGAMIYPAIIVAVMTVIGGVISVFVLPQFSTFLKGMNVPLPIYTRILIGIGDFSQRYWWVFLVAPLVLGYLVVLSLKTKPGRWIKDTLLLKMPLISTFIKKSNSTVLIRSLSSLNSSGISLIRSLEITSATVSNMYFKKAINQAIEKVKKGEKLSNALRPYANIFPFGALDMIEVGEETGKTSVVLKKLADFYEQEVIEITQNFSVIIEPLLIVFLGLLVAFFAISIIEPMYSSLKSI
jgi:type II secretory pathway component PulF